MARTNFSGPVYAENGFLLKSYTVAGLPTAASVGAGVIVYVSNSATNPVIAYSDGTIWRRSDTGAVVA
jgi:hypothetical protein